ncbi:tRNA (adenosine(37)-N6)-threonylcarbamoyltransferase complex transferase subunit TsaD [Spongisporangium articulatum]|uniref:tRNA N6-adenosine threonylcarbamoyltransferase n=1 Tax=Spongisporangium articulatum TaxID=3362603 RepID=A0ABW8AUJ5_9ACTN
MSDESDELILGLETSCDDTSCAVVAPDGRVLGAATVSQIELHNQWGGIVPELASRAHIDKVLVAVDTALTEAGVDPARLTAIGVTRGPGLIGSLKVGVDTAQALGYGWDKPVLGVNHLRGHLRSADLEEKRVTFPALILLVSGGHTLLAHMTSSADIRLLGSTVDDSLGEAYDKVARMLGLGYPGGPVVDRLAKDGTASIPFPRPMLADGLNFSFSGLKTAVRNFLAEHPDAPPADVAASFVAACLEVLEVKCRRALRQVEAESLVIVGGVAASPQVRQRAEAMCTDLGVKLCLPPLRWSTDNGAMIGLAAWDYLARGVDVGLRPTSSLSLDLF